MPEITGDAALAVVPFFGPLLIFVCFTTFMMARNLTQHERRLELLEGRLDRHRFVGATVPRLSPMASLTRVKQQLQLAPAQNV
jgi:hypothetical protein